MMNSLFDARDADKAQGQADELRSRGIGSMEGLFRQLNHLIAAIDISDRPPADLVVHDDGMGIPARHLPRLTERSYQVDEGRSSGTGLGLAIVRQIIDAHETRFLVSSEEGRGATFTSRFPPKCWSQVPVVSGDTGVGE